MSETQNEMTSLPGFQNFRENKPQDRRQEDTPTVFEDESAIAEDDNTFGDRITELAKLSLANPDGPGMLGSQMDVGKVEWVVKVLKNPVDENMKLLHHHYYLREARLNNAMALIEHLQECMGNLEVFLGAADEEGLDLTARDIISLLLILELVLPRLEGLANQIYDLPRF
ncbi:unnamed protein product [Fusarium fujikuroi]|uniref:Uncharacterized protein n=1 Tax=Fusarium fujikuroi TaxID=5127 RepID=A0A9Q9UCC4_FUSFU|nr:uncharacterized protein FFE2_04900 [Fusarium fujikuroi]SCV35396.1 uncharacterized protein FFFS_04716 [Fusarium fujikuroi]VTT63530.1 unnamed protein product [Fusarium fujikuroi]VTT73822.1 unnamed protein product [Fusarium fujikuroi]VZI04258.1 unnamed protein product [Fusarium fujikuroi]